MVAAFIIRLGERRFWISLSCQEREQYLRSEASPALKLRDRRGLEK